MHTSRGGKPFIVHCVRIRIPLRFQRRRKLVFESSPWFIWIIIYWIQFGDEEFKYSAVCFALNVAQSRGSDFKLGSLEELENILPHLALILFVTERSWILK